MAQEDMNVIIPPEMMQEIVRVASETAIEKFQHEAERNRKAVKDKRLHNTKLLLQNYHCFVEHSKSARSSSALTCAVPSTSRHPPTVISAV